MLSRQIGRNEYTAVRRAGFSILALLILTPGMGHSQSIETVTANRSEIIKKLVDYHFDTLNSELTSDEEKAESDPRFEMNAMVAFAAFETPQELIAGRLKDWQKAAPDSYAAALARAVSLTETAFRWRGEAPIRDVPPANVAMMNKVLRYALDAEDAALAINPNLGIAYALRIKAARLSGSSDAMARALGEALKQVPASFAVREQIMFALRPKWGGSREAVKKFDDDSQQYVGQNPAMKFLLAGLSLDIADDYADHGQWDQAINAYNEALKTGGEYWNTYRHRGDAFYDMGKFKEATRDAMRANQLFPQQSQVLKALAMSTGRDNDPEACILWSATFFKFEMPDEDLLAMTAVAAQQLKAQGKENW